MLKVLSILAIGASLLLSACNHDTKNSALTTKSSIASESNKTVKIGVCGEYNEEWYLVQERLAKKGINLEIVKFGDYSLPNRFLNDGEIDLNAFQHRNFLNNEIEQYGYDFAILTNTLYVPLGIYSKKITSLSDLKDGDSIALPSEFHQLSRSLKILQDVGIITLPKGRDYSSEIKDIVSYHKKVEFFLVEANSAVAMLPDVTIALINAQTAWDNGLDPIKDALYSDAKSNISSSNPFVNIAVCRSEDKDNELIKAVIEEYLNPITADSIRNQYNNSTVPAFVLDSDQAL